MTVIKTLRSTHAFSRQQRKRVHRAPIAMAPSDTHDLIVANLKIDPVIMKSFVSSTTATVTVSSSPPPDNAPKRKRKRQRVMYRAQENSLYDILHTNSGETLFTNPLMWTDLHARLLDVEFVDKPTCDTPFPEPSPEPREPSSKARRIAKLLDVALGQPQTPNQRGSPATTSRVMALNAALQAMFPSSGLRHPWQNQKLSIFFWGEAYRAVCRPHGMFEASDGAPAMAFFSKELLEDKRRNKLYAAAPGPKGCPNRAVNRLMELRIQKILPTNRDHDPLLIATFLAMAQKHFYPPTPPIRRWANRHEARGAPMPEFKDVKLRIIAGNNGSEISVYTAVVTAAFLERFHMPTKAPRNSAGGIGMTIEHTKVPVWPLLGLKERLARTLGTDFIGEELGQQGMETWGDESDTESVATECYPSRTNSDAQLSRQALCSISNEKLTAALEETESSSPLKRRRLE